MTDKFYDEAVRAHQDAIECHEALIVVRRERDELRAQVQQAEKDAFEWRTAAMHCEQMENELKAELERLRAVVTAARGIALRRGLQTHDALAAALSELDRPKEC